MKILGTLLSGAIISLTYLVAVSGGSTAVAVCLECYNDPAPESCDQYCGRGDKGSKVSHLA